MLLYCYVHTRNILIMTAATGIFSLKVIWLQDVSGQQIHNS